MSPSLRSWSRPGLPGRRPRVPSWRAPSAEPFRLVLIWSLTVDVLFQRPRTFLRQRIEDTDKFPSLLERLPALRAIGRPSKHEPSDVLSPFSNPWGKRAARSICSLWRRRTQFRADRLSIWPFRRGPATNSSLRLFRNGKGHRGTQTTRRQCSPSKKGPAGTIAETARWSVM